MVYLSVNEHAGAVPATPLNPLLSDLAAAQADLRALLLSLGAEDWDRPTPSPGWTVRHQVRHLAHGEELGRLAATDPEAFAAELTQLVADLYAVEAAATAASDETSDELVARWFSAAQALRSGVALGPGDERIEWVTGPMSRASFLTARVMETFAHGHDIAVTVGRELPVDRVLRHVAHLGVATRGFAFANRALPVPEEQVRVELRGPAGGVWSWGPKDAPDQVRGPALDFCLLVTQRIHRNDTALEASGPHAELWLRIAQCFAGPPSDGPPSIAE
jgi:uncharacterized protein (TIGR03084 family)